MVSTADRSQCLSKVKRVSPMRPSDKLGILGPAILQYECNTERQEVSLASRAWKSCMPNWRQPVHG